MKTIKIAMMTLALSLSFSPITAWAQTSEVHGEVKKIDANAGKITLKHGPIENLGMTEESMTMVFRVQDPAMLTKVKSGDKVAFTADRIDGKITLTAIHKAK